MRRLAHIADSHFNAGPGGRFEECIRIHDWIADDVAGRDVDLVVHSGDIFERKSTPDERRAVAAWIQRITRHAPLVIVRGNHDFPLDLSIFGKLETIHPVVVEEGAGVHGIGGFVVGCLAWPSKASVLAMQGDTVLAHGEGELLAGEALRNVLRGLGDQMDLGHAASLGPKILLAHAMVRGSRVSTGQPLVGCDLELGLEDLELARASYAALGHIHLSQDWEQYAGHTVVYPGSPRRTSFGETEEKSYVIAEFDDDNGALVRWYRVPTPCTNMLLLEGQWGVQDDGSRNWISAWSAPVTAIKDAEVRFRYTVAADLRDEAKEAAARAKAALLEHGAVLVQVEEVVRPSATARAPEVAIARTLEGKLRAYWRARGTDPGAPRDAQLLGKASTLEGMQ